MGDYAYRKCDGQEIKIGTCGVNYYLTFDQWVNGEVWGKDARLMNKNLERQSFRLPIEEEKDILPGDFDFHGFDGADPVRVFFRKEYVDEGNRDYRYTPFVKEIRKYCFENKGQLAMTKKLGKYRFGDFEEGTGIYAYAPCYHGFVADKDEFKGKNFGYNGFNPHVLCITSVGFSSTMEAVATVSCYACEKHICMVGVDEMYQFRPLTSNYEQDFWNTVNLLHRMNRWAVETGRKRQEV
ncbi:hypothetical protein SAMN02745671_01138 [Anaerovibrio lipolyticus DSM 3074]|uniref:Uncharacterized protein n=1 Tax=Anaerovibrio lipolyticus DSM 3074 TaxID=1120997 RepID=A0A1M6CJ86_9FIRM|nr:hypothetical protein [Anaerovibrio lipolyticus]SHI61056.1 hypothetical protein SAMN02745671_01138 [Anaerovibrio lipolyticus DSM 3074]